MLLIRFDSGHSSCTLLFELVHDHERADEAYERLLLIVLDDAHGCESHSNLGSNLLLSAILKSAITVLLENVVDGFDLGATVRVKHVLPLLLVEADAAHLALRSGHRRRLRLLH